jgi:hypothetical protein
MSPPDTTSELQREQGSAERAHQLPGVGDHALELVRNLLVEGRRERVGDGGGDRLGELGPHRQRQACPVGPSDERRLRGELRDGGGLVEPERRDVERLTQLLELGGAAAHRPLGGDAPRLVASERPVDAVAAGVHGLLQLTHQARDHERVGGQACRPRELRRVEVALPRQETTQQLTELVVRPA